MNKYEVQDRIIASFNEGWSGTADEWWAQNPDVSTINNVAPSFTYLKQQQFIEPNGTRRRTRHGGMAQPYRKADV